MAETVRLAMSNIAWTVDEERAIALRLRALGVDGVEVAPSRHWPDLSTVSDRDVALYRNFWLEHGLVISSMQALLYGRPKLTMFQDAATRDRTLAYLRHAVRIGSGLGAQVLVFGSPGNRRRGDVRNTDAFAIATDFFRTLGDDAVDHGVTVGIEANPTEYDCDFLTTNAEVTTFVTSVGHPGIVHHIDVGGTILTNEPLDVVVRDACPVAHVHASEPYLTGLGRHKTAHCAMAAALVGVGYSNWVSIEMRRDEGNPVGAVEDAIRLAAAVYGRR